MSSESKLHTAISEKLRAHVERIEAGEADDLDYLPAVFHELLKSDKNADSRHSESQSALTSLKTELQAAGVAQHAEHQSSIANLAQVMKASHDKVRLDIQTALDGIGVDQKTAHGAMKSSLVDLGQELNAANEKLRVEMHTAVAGVRAEQKSASAELGNAFGIANERLLGTLKRASWLLGALGVANLVLLVWLLIQRS